MQIIEVTGLGVRSSVIRLRRSGTALQFVVYPMIHMGQSSFYANVTARLRTADVVVVEGVGRGTRRRPSPLAAALVMSYRVLKFNRRVGLVEQDIDYEALGIPVVRPDIDQDEFLVGWGRVPPAQRLTTWAILPVITLGRLFGGARIIWTKVTEVNDLPSEVDEQLADDLPELTAAFGGERDRRLLAALRQLHEERGSEAIEVAVVYGAAHVPDLVRGLHDELGYRTRAGDWLTVVDLAGTTDELPPTRRTPLGSRGPAMTGRPPLAALPTTVPRPAETASSPAERTAGVADETAGVAEARTVALPEARMVAQSRALVAMNPDDNLFALADALIRLSTRLAELKRPDEALAAADEAVDIAEEHRDRFDSSYQKICGRAAYTLGRRLDDVGRHDDALVLYAEAVECYRTAFPNDPYQRARVLGRQLNQYTSQLWRRGRYDDAVAGAWEAIQLFRAAAPEAPGEFTSALTVAQRIVTGALRDAAQDPDGATDLEAATGSDAATGRGGRPGAEPA